MPDKTRRAIQNACNELLNHKEIESISVGEIAQAAEISRATFYRYFKDKYEVMSYNYKLIFDQSLEKSHSFRDLMSHIMEAFSDDSWKKRHRIHDYNGMNSFKEFIVAYTMEASERIVRSNRAGKGFTPEEWFQMTVLCHGISHISEILMKGQLPEDKSAQLDILFSMLPDTIKDYHI